MTTAAPAVLGNSIVKHLRSSRASARPGDGTIRSLLDGEIFINEADGVFCTPAANGSTLTFGTLAAAQAAAATAIGAAIGGLAKVATSGAYGDLSGLPALSKVATSGAYGDLAGLPVAGTDFLSPTKAQVSGTFGITGGYGGTNIGIPFGFSGVNGHGRLVPGDSPAHPGYVEYTLPSGTRAGYSGYSDAAGNLQLSGSWAVDQNPLLGDSSGRVASTSFVQGTIEAAAQSGATLTVAGLLAFAMTLPTTDPGVPGAPWLDGGSLVFSQ